MEDAEEYCIEDDVNEEEKKARPVVKNAMDLQRLKLEKLMKNPEKPIIIPEPQKEKDFMQSVPTFVRNVMGSSAGAGSGEFHVYRHLRRKEYARQKFIQAKSIREQLDDEYRQKLEQNRLNAEAKTAKRRAKRLKKKQKMKEKGKRRKKDKDGNQSKEEDQTETSESEEEDKQGEECQVAENKEEESQKKQTENNETGENDDTCNKGESTTSQEAQETGEAECPADKSSDEDKVPKPNLETIAEVLPEKEGPDKDENAKI